MSLVATGELEQLSGRWISGKDLQNRVQAPVERCGQCHFTHSGHPVDVARADVLVDYERQLVGACSGLAVEEPDCRPVSWARSPYERCNLPDTCPAVVREYPQGPTAHLHHGVGYRQLLRGVWRSFLSEPDPQVFRRELGAGPGCDLAQDALYAVRVEVGPSVASRRVEILVWPGLAAGSRCARSCRPLFRRRVR